MTTIYNADFNEYQRKLFVEALEHLIATKPEHLKSQPSDNTVMIPEDTKFEEAQLMLDLLKELPSINEEGLTHGLCH